VWGRDGVRGCGRTVPARKPVIISVAVRVVVVVGSP